MTFPATFFCRLHWLNLPGALLLALLQRTPVLRVLATGAGQAAAAPAAQLMRSVFTAASLGAWHSLAGATAYVQNPASNPVPGTVGTPLAVAFTYTGTPSLPQYFAVTGQLPPGMSFIPAATNGVVRSGTPVISGTPTQAGNYTVRVQGFGTGGNGQPVPINFAITGGSAATPPTFTLQPASQTATAGTTVTFTAGSTGSPTPTYQWQRDGASLVGATAATLTLTDVQPADAGEYSVVATNTATSVTSNRATLTVAVPASAGSYLTNLSIRSTAGSGPQTLIVGVSIGGDATSGAKNVLIRGIGPTLGVFGVTGTLSDPRLDLYSGISVVASNDNWDATATPAATQTAVGAFALTAQSRDAALIGNNLAGSYTVQLTGGGGATGVALAELYDLTSAANVTATTPRLVNISARTQVGTDGDILIAGFNVGGTGSRRLLIRAVGPTLGAFGVSGPLADPRLDVYSGTAVVAANDNWDAIATPSATQTGVGAFALTPDSRDAVLIVALSPGSYTAQVSGVGRTTGVALVEIYEMP